MRHLRLDDKVVIITGAGSGIGRASAMLFAHEGARIVVCDLNEQMGKETVDMITMKGGEAYFTKADVSKAPEVKESILSCLSEYGSLDTLVNCAGICRMEEGEAAVAEVSEEIWNESLAVNLTGTFLCCKYVISAMIERGKGGSIVNISSIAGVVGADRAAYCASKGGIIALTRSISTAYGAKNIRANVICPGIVETPMTKPILENLRLQMSFLKAVPLGRTGTPTEVAYIALYLASDESSFVTGGIFMIDGGFTAR